MGAFKPLLPFGNYTVIEACIDYLRRGGVETIIVVVGHREGDVRNKLAELPVTFAINTPDSEMGVSIIRGVEKIPPDADAVFITLVDQPAIPPEAIRFMIDERERTGASLLVPVNEGRRGHPVLIDLKYRADLLELDPMRGLRAFFETRGPAILVVPIASPYIARDMDTWDDYRALHLEIFHSEPPSAPHS